MQYTNNLKGALAETAICCLLRNAGYPAVPNGIESRMAMLPLLTGAQVASLDLTPEVRLAPDLLILPLGRASVLVEIKYRRQITRDVLQQLLCKAQEQQRYYPTTHTILIRSISPKGAAARADDLIRVLPPNRLELLAAGDVFYHCTAGQEAGEHERLEPVWSALRPMSGAFDALQGAGREMLEHLVPFVLGLEAL